MINYLIFSLVNYVSFNFGPIYNYKTKTTLIHKYSYLKANKK